MILNSINFTNNYPVDSEILITYYHDKLNHRFYFYGEGDLVMNNFSFFCIRLENTSPILFQIINLSNIDNILYKTPDIYEKHSIAFWTGLIVGNNTPSFDIIISN